MEGPMIEISGITLGTDEFPKIIVSQGTWIISHGKCQYSWTLCVLRVNMCPLLNTKPEYGKW